MITIVAPVEWQKMKMTAQQRQIIGNYLQSMEGKNVKLVMTESKKQRTIKQNSYLWGVVYTFIAVETGHTTEEIHTFMKKQFLPRDFITIGKQDQEIEKSTTDLSTKEMNEYIEKIRAFAAQELQMNIPSPEDV